ncbi:MAG: hypothetical protein DMG49_12165 [Acidobacteria bacterium]|nr:MAG: hypothetical protein DMG49_12165 [Acidobacteriota bacterium]
MQRADGGINPYYAGVPMDQGAIQRLDWTRRELGMEAVRVAQKIRAEALPAPSLDFANDGPLVFEDHAGLIATVPAPSALTLSVTALLINKQIAFVGMPGEPLWGSQSTCAVAVPCATACYWATRTDISITSRPFSLPHGEDMVRAIWIPMLPSG